MLTAEQLAARQRTLGASELSAIAGINPWSTPISVWMTKNRGPALDLPPIVEHAEVDKDTCDAFEFAVSTDPRTAGSILESGLIQLYEHRTGAMCVPQMTMAHPDNDWQTATPDSFVYQPPEPDSLHVKNGLVSPPSRGLECKLVSSWLTHHWPGDGVPEYVACQCQWSMHVTGLDMWDVAALVGGSSFRIIRVERDDDLIDGLVELAEHFWHEHVLADVVPPTVNNGRDVIEFIKRRWQEDNGETRDAPPEATTIARELFLAQQRERAAKAETQRLRAAMVAIVGEDRAIKGDFGRFQFASRQGSPAWKAIAEDLAGGVVPAEIIEAHRAESIRASGFYPSKRWKARMMEAVENGEL